MGAPFLVDVCVCTFRRLGLAATLASLKAQTLPADRFRIIVADNDHEPGARPLVEQGLQAWGGFL
jgi:succinoglycan biosynthesis protein ExoM